MRNRALLASSLLAAAAVVLTAATPPNLTPGRDIDTGLGRVNDVVYSSDGRLLAAAGARGYGIWDGQVGTLIRKDAVGTTAVQHVAFNTAGTLLALGLNDGRVLVVDMRTGMTRDMVKHNRPVTAVAFAPDGKTGASGDTDGTINLWDPDRGLIAPLKDGGHKKDIFVLAFTGNNDLLSASTDLQVNKWDVAGKRSVRHGTLQQTITGRTVVPTGGAVDPKGDTLVIASQLVSTPRGGVLAGGSNLARPEDLRRDNILMSYVPSTGESRDPIKTGDYQPEHVALGLGSCFAFFTSDYRNQPRLHVWGLVLQGDDLTRLDLPARATAAAEEPGTHAVAVALESGVIKTWTVSGATPADCDAYRAPTQVVANQPKTTLGSETTPLVKPGPGTRLAVLRFEVTGVDPTLGDAVAEMIGGELSNNPQVTVIERSAIDKVLKEMEIQRSGLTTADAVKIGKGLNARTVLLGSVRKFGDSTYIIQTRAVDVETQQVQGSRDVTCENCKEGDLPRAVRTLRSAIVP